MAQYISKDALVAEIERLRGAQPLDAFQPKEQNKIDWLTGKLFIINSLEIFLDTLEVKEVDLKTEYDICKALAKLVGGSFSKRDFDIAMHFYELGKAQKGEEV